MFTTLKLPFRFDVQRLHADLRQVKPEEWVLHHNRVDYDGGWSGAALRSLNGMTGNLILQQSQTAAFADTPLLARCSYFREVLASFDCPLKSVRLLSLAPQSFIKEHSDRELQYEDGEVRIHIPIQTNPHVEFYSSGDRLLLEEGSTYYLNANLPHRVSNRGTERRVHLVIDAEVNPWLDALFRRALKEDWSVPRLRAEEQFAAFQELVLREPALQSRLQVIANPENFSAEACAFGSQHGLTFDKADIHAAKSALSRGEMPNSCELETSVDALRDWVPLRVHIREHEPIVEWVHFGSVPSSGLLAEHTVAAAANASPFASVFRRYSTLQIAEESACDVEPHGFLFHTSRCGSTLLAQMLATVPHNLVISELPAIEQIAQVHLQLESLSEAKHAAWLRAIVRAYGRKSDGGQAKFFVKLHPWHIHRLPLFQAAFPQTPWIFMYRDPQELLAAHMISPTLHTVPGMVDPRNLQLTVADVDPTDRFGWCCKMLARIFESAIRFHDAHALFLNYTALPEAAWNQVARHFGLQLSENEIASMRVKAQFNAKSPFYWTGKDEPPKVLKDEAQRQIAREQLTPLYEQLEKFAATGRHG